MKYPSKFYWEYKKHLSRVSPRCWLIAILITLGLLVLRMLNPSYFEDWQSSPIKTALIEAFLVTLKIILSYIILMEIESHYKYRELTRKYAPDKEKEQ